MSFFTELWESVFTPGTTPALIKATHASFILLIISLICLIFLSGSIHFYNLLAISILLYGSVVWFISELNQAKLKNNAEIEQESKEDEAEEKKQAEGKKESKASASAVKPTSTPKKRKV